MAAFLLLTILHATGLDGAYRQVLAFFGMLEPTPVFLDTQALLAAVECHAAGIDVMQGNPCDIQNRPHVYGSLWLWLTALRLDRTMTAPIGIGLDLLFLAGLFALPKARRWREVAVLSLACLSPVVVFALERANNDIVVWLLALAAARLVLGGVLARGFAYAIVVLAALLKFYPAVLLVLLSRERLGRAVAIGLALGGALAWVLWRETGTSLKQFQYTAYHTDAFGAWNIAESLLASRAGEAWQQPAMLVVVLAMSGYALSLSVRMVVRFQFLPRIRALPAFEASLARAGGSLLIGCFFAGPSIAYRGILLLLVLPAVLTLWRQAEDRPEDRAGATLFAGMAGAILWCVDLHPEVTHLGT